MIELGKARNYVVSAAVIAVSLIVLRPGLAYMLHRRAGDYMSSFLVADAARTYKKVLFFDEKDVDSRNWLAYCYSLMGMEREAVEEYKKAIGYDPDDTVALFDLGMMAWKRKDIAEAEEYFRKAAAAAKSPNIIEANYKFYTKSARTMLEIIAKNKAKNAGRT